MLYFPATVCVLTCPSSLLQTVEGIIESSNGDIDVAGALLRRESTLPLCDEYIDDNLIESSLDEIDWYGRTGPFDLGDVRTLSDEFVESSPYNAKLGIRGFRNVEGGGGIKVLSELDIVLKIELSGNATLGKSTPLPELTVI
jgi:hypothetical protein